MTQSQTPSQPPSQAEAVSDFFGVGAGSYADRHYRDGRNTFISDRFRLVMAEIDALHLDRNAVVADIACGPGFVLEGIASKGLTPIGLDGSVDMLRVARARVGSRVPLIQGDARHLPFPDESLNLLVSTGLLEYLPDPVEVLREFHRVLVPGGTAIVSSTNRRSPAFALGPIEDWARTSATARRLANSLHLEVPESAWKPREFKFHFITAAEFASFARSAGFSEPRVERYHFQLLPHPADRVAPSVTSWSARVLNPLCNVPLLRELSEGLLVVGRKSR